MEQTKSNQQHGQKPKKQTMGSDSSVFNEIYRNREKSKARKGNASIT
jgi:hypothetical protein